MYLISLVVSNYNWEEDSNIISNSLGYCNEEKNIRKYVEVMLEDIGIDEEYSLERCVDDLINGRSYDGMDNDVRDIKLFISKLDYSNIDGDYFL